LQNFFFYFLFLFAKILRLRAAIFEKKSGLRPQFRLSAGRVRSRRPRAGDPRCIELAHPTGLF